MPNRKGTRREAQRPERGHCNNLFKRGRWLGPLGGGGGGKKGSDSRYPLNIEASRLLTDRIWAGTERDSTGRKPGK